MINRLLNQDALCDLLRLPLRIIPDGVHAQLAGRLSSLLLRQYGMAERLAPLHGKTLCLHITDAEARICLAIDHGRLRATNARVTDVSISGTLRDFCSLADRSEDPDTLFFSRRLCLEGDTATGVHIKNILDSIDFDGQTLLGRLIGAEAAELVVGLIRRTQSQRTAGAD